MTRASDAAIERVAEPAVIAKGMSQAQKDMLARVCRTNGGGVRVRCKVGPDGYGIPLHPPTAKLLAKGLIQGKSGTCECVVHTREGLSVARTIAAQGGEA
jgi:hypothetical protein